jgi:hypothetical protein
LTGPAAWLPNRLAAVAQRAPSPRPAGATTVGRSAGPDGCAAATPSAPSARVAELRDGPQQRGVHGRRRADDAAVQVQPAPAPKVQRRAWPQRRAPRSQAGRGDTCGRPGAAPPATVRALPCPLQRKPPPVCLGAGGVSRQAARGCASSPCVQACRAPAQRPRARCDGAGAGCRRRQPRATRRRWKRPGPWAVAAAGPPAPCTSTQSPRSGPRTRAAGLCCRAPSDQERARMRGL